MPTLNEKTVLRIAHDIKKVNKFVISRRMAIASFYASNLLNTLTVRGYLEKALQGKSGVYRLTPKGRKALTEIGLLKWVGDREQEVLKVVSRFKRASTNLVSRKLHISNDYALLMLKSLAGLNLRTAYLKRVGHCLYELTPSGKKLITK